MSVLAVYAGPGTHQKDGLRLLIRMCNLELNGGINLTKRTGWTSVCESVVEKEIHLVCHWIDDKMTFSIWLLVVEEKKLRIRV